MKLPSVLAFRRGMVITDGLMTSIVDKAEKGPPVRVIRHGIRGVNNSPTLDRHGEIQVANVQRTESAKTSPNAIGLRVDWSIRTIHKRHLLASCSDHAFAKELHGFIDRFFRRGVPEFDEVCLRYSRCIFRGAWLWKNELLGDVSVEARFDGTHGKRICASPGTRQQGFMDYTEDEKSLAADVIATGLLDGSSDTFAEITGRVMFGFQGAVEVFPSQNMVTGTPKGFARSLYKVNPLSRHEMLDILRTEDGDDAGEFMGDMIDMGWGAIRDQKIGNAIRTIDTWYPDYEKIGVPIPIEPSGENLDRNRLFREGKHGAKALLRRIEAMQPSATFNPEAAYLIAILIRGGVFSENSDKTKKKEKEEKDMQPSEA